MQYVTLGRTELRASVAGLGAGGPSRLGQRTGKDYAESVALIHRAMELGVNFFDTAIAYGTEDILGEALAGVARPSVILSTKMGIMHEDRLRTAEEMAAGLEASLERLRTDYVDIFHLHGLRRAQYEYAMEEIVPRLLELKRQGLIRWMGVTESFGSDTRHEMLQRALQDECWEVMMVGFNMLNQSARYTVLPQARRRNIGILAMFVVRRALSNADRLRETMTQLVREGTVDASAYDNDDPLGFLVRCGGAVSLPDAAYRYCRSEPGIHVTLTGTGNMEHLEENVRSILRPPLPAEDVEHINALFAGVDTISGD
jgi:L-galactose dehydrogenase